MYLTRNLVARAALQYLGKAIAPGEAFQATDVDAGYFIRHGRAADAAPGTTNPELFVPVAAAPAANADATAIAPTQEGDGQTTATGNDDAGGEEASKDEPTVGKKPSDGLTVPQLREALTAKGVTIPAGYVSKADLAAMLDEAA